MVTVLRRRTESAPRAGWWRLVVRAWLGASLGALLCSALVAGGLTTASAASDADPTAGTEPLGGFAIGDGLEALIDERDGSLSLTLAAGGLGLNWDSRRVGAEAGDDLGPGWGFGLMTVGTSGGVRVFPASGGSYEADATQPSGLHGYGIRDLVFMQAPSGVEPLEARADGQRAATPYAYVVEQLGGTRTYFQDDGRAVARVTATGQRSDWVWGDAGSGRLAAVIDERGVATELDWRTPGLLAVRPGAGLPDAGHVWQVRFDDDGVRSITDAVGGVVELTASDGLVSGIATPSGSETHVSWSRGDDGVARAARLSTIDRGGRELGHRSWTVAGGGPAAGWPVFGDDRGSTLAGGTGTAGGLGYSTEVSDGSTTIRSSFTGRGVVQSRAVVTSGASGDRVLQEQTLTYPDADAAGPAAGAGGGAAPAMPVNWARPTRATITHHDATGASRSTATEYAYDELGRVTREAAPDGAVTETAYDDEVQGGRALPFGLVERQTHIGADGLLAETRHELNDERTGVVATETSSGGAGAGAGATIAVTGRTEYESRPDGFVTERRVYPAGDRSAAPAVTRWAESTDLEVGSVTRSETTGVGTESEATVTMVAPLGAGGATSTVDALGNRSETVVDALGRPVSSTDTSGLVTRVRYETAQHDGRNATVTTTPDGVELAEEHDELGRPTRVVDNIRDGLAVDGHERVAQTTGYPAPGTTTVTDAWGATTTTTVDVLGRPRRVELPSGLVQVVQHDDVAGSITSWSSPSGDVADADFVATQRHDTAGRPLTSEGDREDGVAVPTGTTEYDGLGRRTGSADGTPTRASSTTRSAGSPPRRSPRSPRSPRSACSHPAMGRCAPATVTTASASGWRRSAPTARVNGRAVRERSTRWGGCVPRPISVAA